MLRPHRAVFRDSIKVDIKISLATNDDCPRPNGSLKIHPMFFMIARFLSKIENEISVLIYSAWYMFLQPRFLFVHQIEFFSDGPPLVRKSTPFSAFFLAFYLQLFWVEEATSDHINKVIACIYRPPSQFGS